MKVSVKSPRTPVTAGSDGFAAATVPNVCKMPGPPAPFVPTPLPNIGKSSDSPAGYSKQVTMEGKKVAIRGASFKSTGDSPSKPTGGGVVSNNTHGPTRFVGPGALTVKVEGKSVHLLGEPMLNNCGPGGSPANAATLLGVIQESGEVIAVEAGNCPMCGKDHGDFGETKTTKTSAGALANNFQRELTAVGAQARVMLGVVECKCGKKFADQSGATRIELCKAAKSAGMKHAEGVTLSYATPLKIPDKLAKRVTDGLWGHLGDRKTFRSKWTWADMVFQKHQKKPAKDEAPLPAAYPPGSCAAQGALLLLMNDDALPSAMTEQWFSSDGTPTKGLVEHIDASSGARMVRSSTFGHGSTVPPCKTCEIVVPLLLCPGTKTTCEHKT